MQTHESEANVMSEPKVPLSAQTHESEAKVISKPESPTFRADSRERSEPYVGAASQLGHVDTKLIEALLPGMGEAGREELASARRSNRGTLSLPQ